jgi:hypothetical protein
MIALPKTDSQPTENTERQAKRRAIVEARASVEAEGTISHADMMAWFRSLGTPDELPPPMPRR